MKTDLNCSARVDTFDPTNSLWDRTIGEHGLRERNDDFANSINSEVDTFLSLHGRTQPALPYD